MGLDFFARACVAVDPGGHRLTVSDSGPDTGIVVSVEVRRDRGSVALFAPLELPSGGVVIIYDGLIGTDFLNRFRYTFDVRRQRLVLAPVSNNFLARTPSFPNGIGQRRLACAQLLWSSTQATRSTLPFRICRDPTSWTLATIHGHSAIGWLGKTPSQLAMLRLSP